jgi:hypothetical protein
MHVPPEQISLAPVQSVSPQHSWHNCPPQQIWPSEAHVAAPHCPAVHESTVQPSPSEQSPSPQQA